MRLLVLGATGFLGRYLLPLVEGEYEVHAVSRDFNPPVRDGVVWHRADLLDERACIELLRETRPARLIHLAWVGDHPKFWNAESNLDWLRVSITLLRLFYETGGRRALVAGTSAEYLTVGAERKGGDLHTSLYGATKSALYAVGSLIAVHHGGSLVWPRIFNVFGPGEPSSKIVPAAIETIRNGETFRCRKGSHVRDFIYIRDCADAIAKLFESELEGAIDIGTGEGTMVKDVVGMVAQMMGGSVEAADSGEVESLVADISRLDSELGWAPSWRLPTALAETITASTGGSLPRSEG